MIVNMETVTQSRINKIIQWTYYAGACFSFQIITEMFYLKFAVVVGINAVHHHSKAPLRSWQWAEYQCCHIETRRGSISQSLTVLPVRLFCSPVSALTKIAPGRQHNRSVQFLDTVSHTMSVLLPPTFPAPVSRATTFRMMAIWDYSDYRPAFCDYPWNQSYARHEKSAVVSLPQVTRNNSAVDDVDGWNIKWSTVAPEIARLINIICDEILLVDRGWIAAVIGKVVGSKGNKRRSLKLRMLVTLVESPSVPAPNLIPVYI